MSGPDDLATRTGLPDALRVLLRDYPRDLWASHKNFDGLTRFWLERHLMFRQAHAQWVADTQAFLDAPSRAEAASRHAQRTAQLGGFLINQLHGHHQIEDAHYFPALAGAEPRLAPGFALLDADHHELDATLAALTDAANAHLRALAETAPGAADPGRTGGALVEKLDGFGGFLDRHLIDEEELVVPVILHHAMRF